MAAARSVDCWHASMVAHAWIRFAQGTEFMLVVLRYRVGAHGVPTFLTRHEVRSACWPRPGFQRAQVGER